MFYTYTLAFLLVCTLCTAQENYYYPEQQQYNGPPAQQFFQDEGQFYNPDNANRRSFQESPQIVTQVFTLPDGSVKALQVPQG